METPQNNLDKQFISDSLSYQSYQGPFSNYSGSSYQINTYNKLLKDDSSYKAFIIKTYGSYENFIQKNKVFNRATIFDPTVDYMLDVTVITNEANYKTDHISSNEIIMESLSGVCSFNFIKKDGTTTKVNGSLDKRFIPPKEWSTRSNFYSPMANQRIGVWDINKQHWSSFFMSRLFKFVRDDTIDIE